jgi:threonine/homoserine/homoserine lactone efflux protein
MFIFALLLSFLGSLPPGLISLTVVRTAIHRGFWAAWIVAFGAAATEYVQALVAVWFAGWFLAHPNVEAGFRWVSAPVLVGLGVYYLFWAKPLGVVREAARVRVRGLFLQGVALSLVNLLAIPYWIAYCGWMKIAGYWVEGLWPTLQFAAGVTVGAQLALGLYAWLGQVVMRRFDAVARWANVVIGLLFLGLGLSACLKIYGAIVG